MSQVLATPDSSASSASSTPTMDTATHSHTGRPTTAAGQPVFMYKGKVTRSWPQLPDELVRHIATFYLWDASVNSYCPQVWETRELWHHRMLYTSIRDALLLEKNIMPICPQWSKALETHFFWQHAIALIDPQDALVLHSVIQPPKSSLPQSNENSRSSTATQAHQDQPIQPTRLTPYWHYRNILSYSCHICRINQPNSSAGLTTAKRLLPSPLLGPIAVCRDHDRRRATFCGICMREAPLFEGAGIPPSYVAAGINPNTALAAQGYNGISLESIVSCLENEDEETWPGVAATCRFCRREWLWRKATTSARDREAIGGSKLSSEDWETRQCVDGFIDLAEGSINDVISLSREKWWLRKYTKLGDMMLQALAAARFTGAGAAGVAAVSTRRSIAARGGGGAHAGSGDGNMYAPELEEEEEEEEEEDDEEDPELMQFTEEGGVRDLALGDWARSRILDGHWFSPADLWYRHVVPGKDIVVPAVHPCPWARDDLGLDTGGDSSADSNGGEEEHPRPATVNAEIPPSYGLCEQAYIAHQRQMRVVLLSPMKNIVRRLVTECIEDTKDGAKGDCTWGGTSDDPALRATKMSLEDVLKILREEEGIWFDGVDWAERRRNNARDRMAGIVPDVAKNRHPDTKTSAEVTSTSPTSTTGSGSGSSETESSNKSGASSSATSPVLSTTTLQTTPSPPPVSSSSPSSLDVTPREPDGDCPESLMDDVEGPIVHANSSTTGKDRVAPPSLPPRPPPRLITIAVSPVLNPPKLLRPIPYVPVTLSHLPHYSIEAFRAVWREACAPLYHCRCKICERAMAKANADAGVNARANGTVTVPVSSSQAPESQTRRNSSTNPQQPAPNTNASDVQSSHNKRSVEIKLDEVAELDGEGEEEVEELEEYSREEGVEYEEYEEEEEEEGDEDLEVSSTFGEYGEARESYSPSSFSRTGTTPDPEASLPADEGQEDPGEDPSEDSHSSRSRPDRHTLHRQCRSGVVSNSDDDDSYLSPPHQSRKRSSDELDEEEEKGEHHRGSQLPDLRRRKKEGTPPKKARKSDGGGTAPPDTSPLSSPTKSRGCGHHRNAAAAAIASPTALQTSPVVTRMRKRNSEELEEDEMEDDDDNTSFAGYSDERTRARRDSKNSRNGSDGSRGSRGRSKGQVTGGSRGGGGGAGSSSDRERGEKNKIAPYKRLKVSSDGGGSDGE